MRYTGKSHARALFLSIIPVCLVIAGHTHASTLLPPTTTPMEKGSPVSPPLGYLSFCQRHADQCGSAEQRVISATLDKGAAASAISDDHGPGSTTDKEGGFNWGLVFSIAKEADFAEDIAVSSASRLDQHLMQVADDNKYETTDLPLPVANEVTWQLLVSVNADVNKRVRSISDILHYGVEDYWELPFEGGGDAGDCEDYALQKRQLLMSFHVPMSALAIAIVKTSWNEPHAVLVVRTDMGAYVLDNLTSAIKPWRDAKYTWVKWQSSFNPDIWVQPAVR
jgi:predicted transglutaminase-like cysteine proteinase